MRDDVPEANVDAPFTVVVAPVCVIEPVMAALPVTVSVVVRTSPSLGEVVSVLIPFVNREPFPERFISEGEGTIHVKRIANSAITPLHSLSLSIMV